MKFHCFANSKYLLILDLRGYLNYKSPFDKNGWYDTKDIVDEKNGYYKINGRKDDLINIGGLKCIPSEVEEIATKFDNVKFVKVFGKKNPITGEHVEMLVQVVKKQNFNISAFKSFLKNNLQSHMVPKRVKLEDIRISHRFKKI